MIFSWPFKTSVSPTSNLESLNSTFNSPGTTLNSSMVTMIRKVRESLPQQTAVVGWRTQQSLSPAAMRVKDVLLDPATWARPGDAMGPDPALEQEQSW